MSDEAMQNNTENVEAQPQQPYQGQPQQPYQGQPVYQQSYGQPQYQNYNQPQSGRGMAIASMALGIVSCVVCWEWYITIPTGILAIILGVLYKRKGLKDGMATAGIICGIVGLSLFVLVIILTIIAGIAWFGWMASCIGSNTWY